MTCKPCEICSAPCEYSFEVGEECSGAVEAVPVKRSSGASMAHLCEIHREWVRTNDGFIIPRKATISKEAVNKLPTLIGSHMPEEDEPCS